MLRFSMPLKLRGAGDTDAVFEESIKDDERGIQKKIVHLINYRRFLSPYIASHLTHLTADLSVFVDGDGSTDYERWKAVFSRIEHMNEIQYFACIRSRTGVYGRFSSIRPLGKAILAVITQEKRKIPDWFDALMSFAPILVDLDAFIKPKEKLTDAPKEVIDSSDQQMEESVCWNFLKRVFCLSKKKSKQAREANVVKKKFELYPDTVYTSLDI